MSLVPSKGSWGELEILRRYFFKVLIPSGVLMGNLVKTIGPHNRDHRLKMKFLRGKPGDKIIAWLNIIGHNFRKLLKALACISSPSGGSLPQQYSRALLSYPPGVGKTYPPIWPTLHGRLNPLGQNSNDGFLGQAVIALPGYDAFLNGLIRFR